MTFRNIRFPTGIRYGAEMGPMFSTSRARVMSGRSQRNKNWTYPARKFTVERAVTSDDLRKELLAFFYNVNGGADSFRIKDATDFEASISEGVFTYLGANRYQMWKRYTSGSYTKDIPVLLPVTGTITVTGYTETTHYTIDYTQPLGIVTMLGSPSPTAPTTWSGQYDIHAIFERDDLPMVIEEGGVFTSQVVIMEEKNTA